MIGFDSNVLIYLLESNPEFVKKSRDIFFSIEKQGGVCSTVVITECIRGNIDGASKMKLLFSPSIRVVPVTPNVAEMAGKIRVSYGLHNLDAIHIATAIASKADVFITNDQKLLKKKIPGIKIRGLG